LRTGSRCTIYVADRYKSGGKSIARYALLSPSFRYDLVFKTESRCTIKPAVKNIARTSLARCLVGRYKNGGEKNTVR
jgi:hypothetical protein